ncbi:LapA family protein [Amycolatopsis jejuensis]|uniref:LapA family protein n=1 Tax=Amycolatopsis jejuensis TaxID=330084 RepID=UPI0005254185|nr:LapA family protein [Amycolatopsis jejuensis]
MLWLFGQIWLWLLVSFLLGAAVMWLLTRMTRPKRAAEPVAAAPLPVPVPVEDPAEETRYFPPVNPYDSGHYDDEVYNDYPDVDPDEPYDPHHAPQNSGGHPLPDPEPRLSGELNWPAEDPPAPHWPDDNEPAPRRPGRSG